MNQFNPLNQLFEPLKTLSVVLKQKEISILCDSLTELGTPSLFVYICYSPFEILDIQEAFSIFISPLEICEEIGIREMRVISK